MKYKYKHIMLSRSLVVFLLTVCACGAFSPTLFPARVESETGNYCLQCAKKLVAALENISQNLPQQKSICNADYNMEELCGSTGGWSRIAFLNMTDSEQNCPPGFQLYNTGGVRACGRPVGGANCSSVKYSSNGISYSQVCGRVVGYQYGSPDAVDGERFIPEANHNDINSYYVDGVSITRGSPRQHVWTLMAGVSDSRNDTGNCPCSTPPGSAQQIQPFIGSHYFCESGNPAKWSYVLYTADPLWDGQGCGSQESICCSAPGLPWFHRNYGNTTTTDYLELRVCADQETTVDDVPVAYYEIYVK